MIELLTLLFLQIDLDDEKLLISLYFDLSSVTFLLHKAAFTDTLSDFCDFFCKRRILIFRFAILRLTSSMIIFGQNRMISWIMFRMCFVGVFGDF